MIFGFFLLKCKIISTENFLLYFFIKKNKNEKQNISKWWRKKMFVLFNHAFSKYFLIFFVDYMYFENNINRYMYMFSNIENNRNNGLHGLTINILTVPSV